MHFSLIAVVFGLACSTVVAQKPICPDERPSCDSCGGGVNVPRCTFGPNNECPCNLPGTPGQVECAVKDPPPEVSSDATLDAGLQLISYFYTDYNEGSFHIKAGDTHNIDMTMGFNHASHVTFTRADPNAAAVDENIDISDLSSAILKLTSSCMRGKIAVGQGRWIIKTDWETNSRVGKRHARDFAVTPSAVEARSEPKNALMPREGSDRDTTIKVVAGWTLYRLALATVDAYFGSSVVAWDDNEKDSIDSVAKIAADQMQSKGDANGLNIRGQTNEYGLYLSLYGYEGWKDAAADIQQHGNVQQILKELAEEGMKDAAARKTIAGIYEYAIHDGDVNDPFTKSIRIIVRRIKVKGNDQSKPPTTGVCHLPQDVAAKRDLLASRTIDGSWSTDQEGTDNEDPSIGFMVNALLNNNFRFLYHRLIRTWRDNSNQANDEGIVEYAWMIGPDVEDAEDNRRYQAAHPRGTIFFVMHLHFDAFVHPSDGHSDLIPQVQAVNFFHATQVDRQALNNPRVDGRQRNAGQINERLVSFRCEDDNGGPWYPGEQNDHVDPLLNELGTFMRSHWMVDGNGALSAVRGQANANGNDLNWRNPPLGDGQGSAEGPSINQDGNNWQPDRDM